MADVQLGLLGGGPRAVGDRIEYPLAEAEPLVLWPRWYTDDGLRDTLRDTLPWEQHELWTPAGQVKAPRLECWLADEAGVPYVYSGERYDSHRLGDYRVLGALLQSVQRGTGERFDAVFCNLYRTGDDSIGWHDDDVEDALGPAAEIVIASLSLGARRTFQLKNKTTDERVSLELGQGDLLLMGKGTQSAYLHRIPKRPGCGPRINLTFRRLA